ncbi:MAG: aminoacyl-tRNA hydrolase [Candidatus Omnitrophica bacterium]|nr:aminoacyl-tRNA hydrolase [Candidatus Omnitrophota bacterium]
MIFVGLGNPGKEYLATRHNVGFKVVEKIKESAKIIEIYKKKYFTGWKIDMEGKETIIVKPKTYMNESGIAVKMALDFFKAKVENLYLIHDDLDIQLGKIKIIRDRGPGGHKGVISVIENLKNDNFVRIRVGIRGEKIETNYIEYVLSPFLPEEKEIIEETTKRVVAAIKEILKSNLEKAMSLYNN